MQQVICKTDLHFFPFFKITIQKWSYANPFHRVVLLKINVIFTVRKQVEIRAGIKNITGYFAIKVYIQ